MQRDEWQAQMPAPLAGGCFCGAVRFEIDDVFDAGYCRCAICRRMSGAPAILWAQAERSKFRIVNGTPSAHLSTPGWARYFCGSCGAPVYQCDPNGDGSAEDRVCVLLPTLDNPEAVRPTVHIWCSSGLRYFETTDDAPRFPRGEITHPQTRGPSRAA